MRLLRPLRHVLFFLSFAAAAASPAFAVPVARPEPMPFSGNEWQVMSKSEKFACVLGSIIWLDRQGVPFQHSPNQYIAAVDRLLAERPELAREDILSIFAKLVFDEEPQSRPALLGISARLNRQAMALASVQSSA